MRPPDSLGPDHHTSLHHYCLWPDILRARFVPERCSRRKQGRANLQSAAFEPRSPLLSQPTEQRSMCSDSEQKIRLPLSRLSLLLLPIPHPPSPMSNTIDGECLRPSTKADGLERVARAIASYVREAVTWLLHNLEYVPSDSNG